MEYVSVSGAEIPKLGLGTANLTDDTCTRIVETALKKGYRHIDTAQFYDNEAAIGTALARTDVDRSEIFLTTKVWRSNLKHEDVLESTNASLDRLGVESVDLLLIHWPHPRVPIAETIEAMETLRAAGTVKHIGVSNFTVGQLESAIDVADAPIVANQIHYNPYADRTSLRGACQRQDVALIAYSPLAKGRVTEDAILQSVGERYGKSPAQVALRWLIQQEPVVTIPRTSNTAHLEENLAVFDFELSAGEMAKIHNVSGGIRDRLANMMPTFVRSFPF